ncbi:MAG: MSHA fimbrial biogenesis protein MshJ [Gammaproteobacteria bacterium]|nr:MAG: MSHA fimbrial biogenesis protein MshJ [Gammaproteobacteria bacterium]
MKDKLTQVMEKIDAMTLRERLMVGGVMLVLIFFIWDNAFLQPLEKHKKQLNEQVQEKQGQLTKLESQINQIITRSQVDPNEELRKQQAAISQQLEALNKRLQELTVDLIDPVKMARVLEEVLTRETGLTLVKLENLGSTSLLDEIGAPRQSGPGQGPLGVYKHELELTLTGSYLEIVDYLKALEELPRGFYWKQASLTVQDYPVVELILKVHTLSLKENWIGI